jgi:hypothetical protein
MKGQSCYFKELRDIAHWHCFSYRRMSLEREHEEISMKSEQRTFTDPSIPAGFLAKDKPFKIEPYFGND